MESHTWLWRWKKPDHILVHISWPDRHVYFYRDYTRIFSPNRTRQLGVLACRKACRDPYSGSRQKRGVRQAETLRGRQKRKWNVFKGSLTRDFCLQVLKNRFSLRALECKQQPSSTVSQRNKKKIPVSKFFHLSPGLTTPVINLYFRNGPYRNRETESWKTPEVENLVSDSL